jgi:hypothetical protein
MNIFFLDYDAAKAAEYHCDKHVVKMILETAQIISTVYSRYDKHEPWMLKPCFHNHPCTLWAGKSRQNMLWLVTLGISLNRQYTERYQKEHSYFDLFMKFGSMRHAFMPDLGMTDPALAMPEQRRLQCPVESYRLYYMTDKRDIVKWKNGAPKWFI